MEYKNFTINVTSKNNLIKDIELFDSLPNVREILDTMPYVVLILNEQRQVIYRNKKLQELMSDKIVEEFFGFKTGNEISCINSQGSEADCGTKESCKYCGIFRTIRKCQITNSTSVEESMMTSIINGEEISFDFSVSASPYQINGTKFIILTLTDISNEKRRSILERIFFHDVLNTAGSLRGIIDLLKESKDEDYQRFINLAEVTASELVDEIIAQRELMLAENNELKVNLKTINSITIIKEAIAQIISHPIALNHKVEIDISSENIKFSSDEALLKRILINMLKNALEATSEQDVVKIGCCKKKNEIIFWVNNPTFISRNVQIQIFKRSFSSKGNNRGIGTYSMKLLAEKYLKGKISFETSRQNGTKFCVSLPA